MRISDWSSDVCSSDLVVVFGPRAAEHIVGQSGVVSENTRDVVAPILPGERRNACDRPVSTRTCHRAACGCARAAAVRGPPRSEEHTSELQSLMRISYAVFSLKTKINNITQ